MPPQCFATTSDEARGGARNPCYVCHTTSEAPNFVSDDDLQLSLNFPGPAAKNPWRNLRDPPASHAVPPSDEATLAYVRRSNYFDADGQLSLARTATPPSDPASKPGLFVPDAYFRFDDRGFDHRPDGERTGWRAYAYYPFPGFFPTNGSFDDVLIRLDPRFRKNARGAWDDDVYVVNLAIAEALVIRANVAIDPVDETMFGVDLDLDGRLGRATRVVFSATGEATRMHYVGLAKDDPDLHIAPGLLPQGTEFLHTVRYLDVGEGGRVTMAPRMKEVRYAKKVRWASYAIAKAQAIAEAREQDETADSVHEVAWSKESGVFLRRGWVLQGFIEDQDGALRTQTFEETAFCEGCHGGIGVTVDSTFSFARKLGPEAPAHGWFHASQHETYLLGDPRRVDGDREYETYLRAAKGGDDFAANREVIARFFNEDGTPNEVALRKLGDDTSPLMLPSAERALELDRASMAIVHAQSFDRGRDAVLAPVGNVFDAVPLGAKTGISRQLSEPRLRREKMVDGQTVPQSSLGRHSAARRAD